jgi:hypothetical protein
MSKNNFILVYFFVLSWNITFANYSKHSVHVHTFNWSHLICFIIFHTKGKCDQLMVLQYLKYYFCYFVCVGFNATYIMAVSFTGGGHRSIRRKPHTNCKSLTNFITLNCSWYLFNVGCTNSQNNGGRHGRDCMVVGFITTYAISAYHL